MRHFEVYFTFNVVFFLHVRYRISRYNLTQVIAVLSHLPRESCYEALIFLASHTVGHYGRLVLLSLGYIHQGYLVRLTTVEKR